MESSRACLARVHLSPLRGASRGSGLTDENGLVAFLFLQPAREFLEGRDHGLLILGSGTELKLCNYLLTSFDFLEVAQIRRVGVQ